MGIFDRLGDVIRSYLNDTGPGFTAGPSMGRRYADPDLDAAYEELDDFLEGKDKAGGRADTGENGFSHEGNAGNAGSKTPPESLRGDFDALGLPFGASAEECKAAYKKLLKLHHPDRHAGHEGNMKKATEKSARINAAYDRIEKWRATGKAE
ncbi:J domain-containing protein [Treponema primitia]|uniref:J domain-containing protein n=1 Tax=Treponema primitia TaxID=88058 RepID=UPI0002555781|nr:J domain-containing protein [Treponema primitia]